jgi:hypothetical protein
MKAEVRRQEAEGIKFILQAFPVFLMVAFSYKVWRDGNRHRQLCAIYAELY